MVSEEADATALDDEAAMAFELASSVRSSFCFLTMRRASSLASVADAAVVVVVVADLAAVVAADEALPVNDDEVCPPRGFEAAEYVELRLVVDIHVTEDELEPDMAADELSAATELADIGCCCCCCCCCCWFELLFFLDK